MSNQGNTHDCDVPRHDASVVSAAGGVLWRRRHDGSIELLLVFRQKYNDWSFPKGKLRRGESFAQAAIREIQEETSYDVVLGLALHPTTYTLPSGKIKQVQYWETEITRNHDVDRQYLEQQNEIADVRWMAAHEARLLLSYDSERLLINQLLAQKSL